MAFISHSCASLVAQEESLVLHELPSLKGAEKVLLLESKDQLGVEEEYDAIVCRHLIEFEEKPQLLIHSMKTALKPGGTAVVLVYPKEALIGEVENCLVYRSSLSFKQYIELFNREDFHHFTLQRHRLSLQCADRESFKMGLREWLPDAEEGCLEAMADLAGGKTGYFFASKVFVFTCVK